MNGILILDKPQGFTSFDAVAVLRGLAREKKIGHTGTLDPMATGVLPVLLGRAAKALNFLPDTDKEYTAAFRLGERRDTGDITGQVVEESPAPVSQEALEAALPAFRGEILQVPPMYSAVSVGGKRLYELARKGLEVERQARPVTVSALELLSYDAQSREGRLRVACSKGTYIRVLIEDIAKAAGSCGTMTALRRVRACGFGEGDARSLEELKARGLWVYAADMDGAPWCQTDFTGPVALVIGSEGRGVSRLVKEKADFVVSLPLKGKINSLNASVAAGILCYEVSRQRGGLKAVNP